MSSTYYIIDSTKNNSQLIQWAKSIPCTRLIEANADSQIACVFTELKSDSGKLPHEYILVDLPKRRRKVLTTIAEVHFVSKAGKLSPTLETIRRSFRSWLKDLHCIRNTKNNIDDFSYFLEGSTKNIADKVFATAEGYQLLNQESFFILPDDTPHAIDVLCKKLKLRGIECDVE